TEHLVIFYLWGKLDLDDTLGLLRRFYQEAPVVLRQHAMEFAGRVMSDSDLDADQCGRLQRFWITRAEALSDASPADKSELERFGWWFIANRCDQDWLIHE